MYEPEAEVLEEPPVHIPEPVVSVGVPVVEKPALRQSSRIRSEPVRCGYPTKVLQITVKKNLQQYGDKAHSW